MLVDVAAVNPEELERLVSHWKPLNDSNRLSLLRLGRWHVPDVWT